MEQLTIRELLSHAAHDVKIQWHDSKDIWGISYGETDYVNQRYSLETLVFTVGEQDKEPLGWSLLLRPLSQLTETIEHNGKSFFPYLFWDDKARIELLSTCSTDYLHCEYLEYFIMEQLFEWHFDVFGLIPRNLALPIKK